MQPCPHCQTPNPPNAKFCNECGQLLNVAAANAQEIGVQVNASTVGGDVTGRDKTTINNPGPGAAAASSGVAASAGSAAVGGSVGGDVIVVSGSVLGNIYKIYQSPPGKAALSDTEFKRILEEYLCWVSNAYSKARLYGLESLPTAQGRPVRSLSDVFVPLTLRRFQPLRRDDVESLAGVERGEMAHERAYLKLVEARKGEGEEVPVRQLLTTCNHLAVIGGAGCGKSTLLAYLAAALARPGSALPFELPRGVKTLVPVLIPLRYFREYLTLCQQSVELRVRDPRAGTLAGFVPWYLKRRSPALEASEDFFNRLLQGGGCLLMLDGLDEVVSRDDRGRVRQQVEDLVNDVYPGNCLIVTAREAGYRENAVFGDNFTRFDVQRLTAEQIGVLVANWCAQLYPGEEDKRTAELVDDIESLNALRADRDLPPLVSTPLLTTMVISVKWGETELPRERAKLYEACVKVILQAQHILEDAARKELVDWGGSWEDQRYWLAALALAMHRSGRAGAAVSETGLREALRPLADPASLNKFIEAVRYRGGLLEERAELFQFVHLTFQEFLAARLLAKQQQAALAELRRYVADPWWREVFLLTYGLAQADYPPFAREYLRWLSTLTGEARLPGLDLAGSALLELEKPQPEARREQAKQLAAALMDPTLAAPALGRARTGDTLARLGDPRPGLAPTTLAELAEMEFCYIPPGPFVMGEGKEQHTNKTLTDGYWLARYPVTVAQFKLFVEQTGYKVRNEDILRGLASHPVWNVTWHEALAFCRWLTEKLSSVLPEGYVFTLPSEAEWEKAARGGLELLAAPVVCRAGLALPATLKGQANPLPARGYPWGDEFEANKANTDESKIWNVSAVGCFPDGASPYSVLDMSGNVWGWTRSHYKDYPYDPKDDRENLEAPDDVGRVLRGGSFIYGARLARCAFRNYLYPNSWFDHCGFRVCVAAPILSRL